MKKMNSKGIEMSFAWIFAIIVGIFIFVLAFILISKIFETGNQQSDARVAKEIGILLNPLETGFEEGKTSSFTIPTNSRIMNKCYLEGTFGRQIISVSQFSFGKWSNTDVDVGFSNKYIFSNNITEGKKFYIFSKPFDFPFKVSDVIYITSASDKYCFVDAPEDIEDELSKLGQDNIFLDDCEDDDEKIKVCFNGNSCEVNVRMNSGSVLKNGETMYFQTDALMYAAIFSESTLYECQLKRLMNRTKLLSELYIDKIGFSASRGCNSNLGPQLNILNALAAGFGRSSELASIKTMADNIESKNNQAVCKLW